MKDERKAKENLINKSALGHGLHPSSFILHPSKRSLGQNFLVDRKIAKRIVDELGPRAGETIVEVGPGQGALTEWLVESGARVIAVELDRELAPALGERYAGRENFSVVEADAMKIDYCSLLAPAGSGRLISNLPYNVATAILQRVIEQRACISEMVVMVQREVAARIVAAPGTPERGFLSALVQMFCAAESLFDVAPAAFRPAPKVWSTVLRLTARANAPLNGGYSQALLLRLLSASFAQRRKTLFNNLRAAPPDLKQMLEQAGGVRLVLDAVGIDPARRAETVSNQEWAALTARLTGV